MFMFIVRHGETEWNQIGLVQGRSDNPLNKNGIQQAKRMANVFQGKTFEVVLTSPLKRTKETAQYLCADARILSVREDRRLIEKDFGICEGKTIKERYLNFPNGHAPGEGSFQIVRKRMKEAISEYAQMYKGNILIVTHGCAIAALLKELDPIYDKQFVRLNNTSVTILDEHLKIHGFDLDEEQVLNWMNQH